MNVPNSKLLTVLALTSALGLAPNISAQTQKKSEHEHPSGAGVAKMPMHQHMQRMHAEMAKIHATTDPEERRKLMQAHMQSMRGMMQMMHGMMAGDSGGGMHHRRGAQRGGGNHGQGMMNQPCGDGDRLARMEQRMNMMQMMMDHMLNNQTEQLKAE